MSRKVLLGLALLIGAIGASTPALADKPGVTDVVVRSDKSVAEIQKYVDDVDRRLQKGRYDNVDKKEHTWIVDQIIGLRESLKTADVTTAPTPQMVKQISTFETGMIQIEEGGIVCTRERPTGSRMVKQRCRTRKNIEEEREASQDSLRNVKRPQSLPSGG